MKNIFKIILVAVLTVVSSALITFIILSELPNIKNTISLNNSPPKVLIIRSDSMSPGLPVGSLIAVKPNTTYKKGDVISFLSDRDLVITHRISEVVSNESGGLSYQTKGDANSGVDQETVPNNKVIGVGVWALPYIGYLLSFLKTKLGFALFVLTPSILIIFSELKNIIKETKNILVKRKKRKPHNAAFSLKSLLILLLFLIPFSYLKTSNAILSDTEASQASITTTLWGNVTPTPQQWDKSSLHFDEGYGCQGDCEEISAKVCNGEDAEDMKGPTEWELYSTDSGNPKDGSVIDSGIINPLEHGACQVLSYSPNGAEGNYMFKAEQRPGHPGQGVLWSEACEILQCETEGNIESNLSLRSGLKMVSRVEP